MAVSRNIICFISKEVDARKSLVLSRRMNPLRRILGLLKLTRADRQVIARVESPVLNVPRRSRMSDPYPISHQLNVYDGNRPTFKAPPLK